MKEKEQNNMECYCGSGLKTPHELGIEGCYREKVKNKPIKVKSSDDILTGRKTFWFVEGQIITETTLKQQRGYSQHDCGNWSRPKDHKSVNSLSDET